MIEEIVLPDIEEELDNIFEKVTKTKDSKEFNTQINDLHEMRDEFKEILKEIEEKTLTKEECIEIYEEIKSMIIEEE